MRTQRLMIMVDLEGLELSALFNGISQENIKAMLQCLHAKVKEYEKGEMVLWEGEDINEIGIVLSGHARTVKSDLSGKNTIVTLLNKGSYIAILLAVSRERKSPVSVQAEDHLKVLFLPVEAVIKRCSKNCPRHELLLRNIMDGIAEKALVLHDRNDCLIKPTVREKVLTYLARLEKEKGSNDFTIPMDRNTMAQYLNVERSALSRELSNMKKEGYIDFCKNHFTVYKVE